MRKTNEYIDTFKIDRDARALRAQWIAAFFERRKR